MEPLEFGQPITDELTKAYFDALREWEALERGEDSYIDWYYGIHKSHFGFELPRIMYTRARKDVEELCMLGEIGLGVLEKSEEKHPEN